MAQEHFGALSKKVRAVKAKAARLGKAVAGHIDRLKAVRKSMAAARDLDRKTCEELAHRYAKSEKAAGEMEEYYNERIGYYKGLCVSGCGACLARRKEYVELYEKYARSLEQIRRLQRKAEFEELKKKFSKPPMADK